MARNEIPNEVPTVQLHRKEVEKEEECGLFPVKGQKTNDKDKKGMKLQRFLRLYLYSAAKWRDCNCYFNMIFCIVAVVQIAKTVLITLQMLQFGNERSQFQDLVDRGKTTLHHLLLLRWETGMEVPPYPSTSGKYAVYTIDDLTKHINFAVEKFYEMVSQGTAMNYRYTFPHREQLNSQLYVHYTVYNYSGMFHVISYLFVPVGYYEKHNEHTNLDFVVTVLTLPLVATAPVYLIGFSGVYYSSPNDAVGIYMLDGSTNTDAHAVMFCVNYFTYDAVEPGHGKHKAEIHDVCFKPKYNGGNYSYNIMADMENNNMNESIVFNSFLKISLTFHLFSLRLDSLTRSGRCLSIQGIISFTDKDNNGQALVDLQTDTGEVSCKDINVDLPDVDIRHIMELPISVFVIVICSISLIAMVVDLFLGVCLCYKTRKYMKQYSKRHFPGQKNAFPLKEYACHIKGWNFLVIIGDSFTVYGTICTVLTHEEKWRLAKYDEYAMFLGLGCLLCWICLARYLHFNKKFHLLFKTMYHAMPDVLTYLLCVLLLFWGFTFCGYVVLGPYHMKFQNISMAASTLFSTISGDEITVTLAAIEIDKLGSPFVWWFAQIYLCLFISIFTIVILNILIAIFISSYEAIQKEYEEKKKNTDPLRRVLCELLHTEDNLQGSIGQVKNGLLEILNREDNSDMSPREYDLRQELKAFVMVNNTSRKPKIKAFMESGGKRLNKHCSCWRVHCIIPKEDMEF